MISKKRVRRKKPEADSVAKEPIQEPVIEKEQR